MVNKKDIDDLKKDILDRFDANENKFSVLLEAVVTKCNKNEEKISVIENQVDQAKSELMDLAISQQKITDENKMLQQRLTETEEQVHLMEAAMKRENLRFFGVPHQKESTEENLKDFLKDVFGMADNQVSGIVLQKCYRVGKPMTNGMPDNRPVIARFCNSKDVDAVFVDATRKPAGKKGGVAPDLPKTWLETRKQAQDMVKAAKLNNCKVKWTTRNELIINGQKINPKDKWDTVKVKLNVV